MPYLTRRGPLVAAAMRPSPKPRAWRPSSRQAAAPPTTGRFIARICNELIEFGPLNATIHKANECVAIAELEPLSCAYQGMLARC